MPDLKLSEIMQMQRELQDKHKGQWTPLTPEYGRSSLLWMVEELGEVVSIVKKRKEAAIMTNPEVRAAFTEEFVDVLMFMNDALMCYGITAEDLSAAFLKKHAKNMGRDWNVEEANYLPGKK